jgi:hypothetical protein
MRCLRTPTTTHGPSESLLHLRPLCEPGPVAHDGNANPQASQNIPDLVVAVPQIMIWAPLARGPAGQVLVAAGEPPPRRTALNAPAR